MFRNHQCLLSMHKMGMRLIFTILVMITILDGFLHFGLKRHNIAHAKQILLDVGMGNIIVFNRKASNIIWIFSLVYNFCTRANTQYFLQGNLQVTFTNSLCIAWWPVALCQCLLLVQFFYLTDHFDWSVSHTLLQTFPLNTSYRYLISSWKYWICIWSHFITLFFYPFFIFHRMKIFVPLHEWDNIHYLLKIQICKQI